MRDQKICHLELLFEIDDEIQYLSLDGVVESRNWFIENQELRSETKCTSEANALALSTREVTRETSGIIGIEADHLHKLPNSSLEVTAFRHLVNKHRLTDDLTHSSFRI